MKKICFLLTWLLTGFSIAGNTGSTQNAFLFTYKTYAGLECICFEAKVSPAPVNSAFKPQTDIIPVCKHEIPVD